MLKPLTLFASLFLAVSVFAQRAPTEPLDSLQKRAAAGDAKAQNELGVRYRTGDGVERDNVKAAEWYRAAAKQGYAVAYFNLGTAFYNGDGVTDNENAACKWFLLAAEAGDPSGKDAYEREKQDPRTHNGTDCIVLAGDTYLKGDEIPKNDSKAVEMYTRASKLGNASADARLYNLYMQGKAVEKNQALALDYLNRAASQHERAAIMVRAQLYEKGIGVTANPHRACQDYDEAARLGEPAAHAALGTLLLNGRGVKQNMVEACFQFQRAYGLGYSSAKPQLDECVAQLTKKQLDQLKTIVASHPSKDYVRCQ